MSSKDSIGILLLAMVVAFSTIALIPWSVNHPGDLRNKNQISCDELGGNYNGFKGGWICVKDGLIVDMSK